MDLGVDERGLEHSVIDEISIQGFKSLANLDSLKLGKVNVFIGANGSGKSNLLEAIGVLSAAAGGRVDDEALLRRGVRPGIPQLYKTSLKNGPKASALIRFMVTGVWKNSLAVYNVSLDYAKELAAWSYHNESLLTGDSLIFEREGKARPDLAVAEQPVTYNLSGSAPKLQPGTGMAAALRGYADLAGSPAELLQLLEGYAIFSPTTPTLRGVQPDTEQRNPMGLLGGRLAEAVEEILDLKDERLADLDLTEIYDLLGWVSKLDVTQPSRQLLAASVPSLRQVIRFEDQWMGEKRNQLSGYDASEGALYVLFMLVLALHPKTPRFFAVDTFDQAMHPRLARALTRLFCQQILAANPARQVLLTTHNPLVLDGLDLRNDQIRLFVVERNFETGGATRVHRIIVSDEILEADQSGLSLSNLWIMGRLGGVPDLF